jgi:hypothetical protein
MTRGIVSKRLDPLLHCIAPQELVGELLTILSSAAYFSCGVYDF